MRSILSRMNRILGFTMVVWISALGGAAQEPTAPEVTSFEFQDQDKLVLLGGTHLEREQRYAHLETALTLALADKRLSVRNLAWSADTVYGDARSYFGPPSEGLQRLEEQLDLLRPTVVLLNYGTDLAHSGLKQLPDFLTAYRNLIEIIRKTSPGVRLIITSPPPLENLGPPMPDQVDANKNLSSLREALSKFAKSQNAFFIDWFELMGGLPGPERVQKPLTENGIHHTSAGYEKLTEITLKALKLQVPDISNPAAEAVRQEILKKDFLFFNRYRPQNETYLFGFRKHEQGQNAKEIPMFDPLLAKADKKIHDLKLKALREAHQP
jgi:lysophospholipase L1-like esterase